MPAPPVPAAEAVRRRAQIRRLRRRALVFIVGVPLLLLAVALYFAFGPKPPPPPLVLPVSPVQAADAARRIDAVRQALTQPPAPQPPATISKGNAVHIVEVHAPVPPQPVQESRGSDGQDVVTLRVSQSDVNAYLASNPKSLSLLRSHGISAISVQLDPPDQITIHAHALLRGLSGNGVILASLTPDPKTAVHLTITDARFGRLPPPVIKSAVNALIARLLGKAHGPLPLNIQSVQVVGTDLVLRGARRAAAKG